MGSPKELEREILRIAADSDGIVGMYCEQLATNVRVSIQGEEPFPMASTYKLAMAMLLLRQIDEGESSLKQMVEIGQDDLSPGGGLIKANIFHPGVALSVHNLLSLALTVSDNTATDMVLRLAGGPEAVTEFLQGLGIVGMRVDRSTKLVIADAYGAMEALSQEGWSYAFLKQKTELFAADPEDEPAEKYLKNVRDTSTPEAMGRLLGLLLDGKLLGASSTQTLLDIMRRCETGERRIRGLLPPGAVVADKTGTIPKVAVNDVGIIELPESRGELILCVFVKSRGGGSFINSEQAERTIAQIARTVYDFWLFG